jgi:glutathione S-transferase
MKLYNFPASPNAIKVWAVIHHLGLEVESVIVNFAEGTMRSEEYGKINPNRLMPTLVDEDFSLWESNAIMQYLANKAGDTKLWPTSPRAQADVSRWQCWQLAHWGQCMRPFMYENVVKKLFNMGPPDAAKLAEGAEMLHKHAPVLETHLANRTWVCGDHMTLADLSLASPLGYTEVAGIPLQDYPNIRAWYSRLEALDSWKKAQPQMPSHA